MKKAVILILCLLSACSSSRIKQLKEKTDKQFDDIIDIRDIQTEFSIDLDRLRHELRVLSGKVEELEYLTKGKTAAIEKTLAKVSARVPLPVGIPEKLLIQDEHEISRISDQGVEEFREGLVLLRAANYGDAAVKFHQFTIINPNTSFSDNAFFWKGICYHQLRNYDRAIVAYSEVFQNFPGEDRASVSLFKLGEVFNLIGEIEQSRFAWEKLIESYPKSPFARRAKRELRNLSQ